jgi:CheY-like chemotaxis protein
MGAKILVVDDSNTIQTAVQLTFSRENVELIPARSGEEAIRKAKEVVPDLMLIDTVLPDASGYEVCRTLMADPAMRDVPVIMLTGAFEAPDDPMERTVGAKDFIAKPFESQTLIAKVKQLLDSRPMRLPTPAGITFETTPPWEAPRSPYLEEAGSPSLEAELPFAPFLTPPPILPPVTSQEGPTPFSGEPPAAAVSPPLAAPGEFAERLLEQAVTQAAEQGFTHMAKEVTEKLVERIEQIVREVVPALAESLILKEIERIKASIEEKTAE